MEKPKLIMDDRLCSFFHSPDGPALAVMQLLDLRSLVNLMTTCQRMRSLLKEGLWWDMFITSLLHRIVLEPESTLGQMVARVEGTGNQALVEVVFHEVKRTIFIWYGSNQSGQWTWTLTIVDLVLGIREFHSRRCSPIAQNMAESVEIEVLNEEMKSLVELCAKESMPESVLTRLRVGLQTVDGVMWR